MTGSNAAGIKCWGGEGQSSSTGDSPPAIRSFQDQSRCRVDRAISGAAVSGLSCGGTLQLFLRQSSSGLTETAVRGCRLTASRTDAHEESPASLFVGR